MVRKVVEGKGANKHTWESHFCRVQSWACLIIPLSVPGDRYYSPHSTEKDIRLKEAI
jgi:hypothetical protein